MGNNAVGRKAQQRMKCKTAVLLDEVFPVQGEEGGEYSSFSTPDSQQPMLRSQLAHGRQRYHPVHGLTVTESLQAGLAPFAEDGEDRRDFIPCPEQGWLSEIIPG